MKNLLRFSLLVLALSAVTTAHANDAVFDSNGVKIRYVTQGQGEPVVLIHGWMADSSMWGADAAGNTKLRGADGFQVIAIDCRGHGKSDKPHDESKYGTELAADVVRLLDHLKIKKAHLVGYSSGAFIAGNVAATHPERVLSVVYGGQAPLVTTNKPPATPAPKAAAKPSKKSTGSNEVDVFARAVDEGKDLGAYIMAVTPADRPKPTAEQASAFAKFMFNGKDVKALAAAGRSFGDLEVTAEQLKRCQAPILFIHGGNESDIVKSRVAKVHRLIGQGDVKIIEGTDHMTTLAKPEFGKTIEDFLRANKQN